MMFKNVILSPLWLYGLFGNLGSIICLILLWINPSSEKSSVIFGLSIWRLAAGVILLCGFAITGKIVINASTDRKYFPFKSWIVQFDHFNSVVKALFLGLVLSFFLILSQLPPISSGLLEIFEQRDINWFRGLYTFLRVTSRFLPVVIWLLYIIILSLSLLFFTFKTEAQRILNIRVILRWLLVGAILVFTTFHWTTILLQLKVFLQIPGWKWWFTEKPPHITQWIIFPLVAVVLLVAKFLQSRDKNERWKWLFVFALGYFIQVAFGYLDGGGWESLRLKYAESVFSRYAEVASGNRTLIENLRNYEIWYGNQGYLETKPPGILIPYHFARTIYEWFHPGANEQERFWGITQVAAYLFPVSGYLVVFFLAKLSGSIQGLMFNGALPGLLYITCPSVILIPIFLDQTLFPLLFLILIWINLQLMNKKSQIWAFILGGISYIFFYFSFSLLPFILLASIWMVIDWYQSPTNVRRKYFTIWIACVSGFLVMMCLFYLFLNYDPFLRYSTAMVEHRETRGLVSGFERLTDMLILNNAEMVAYTGFPIMILFSAAVIRNVFDIVKNNDITQSQGFLISFIGMIALLNIFSQTLGEVQRLWLFLVPILSVYSAQELLTLEKNQKGLPYLIIVLQLLTAFLLYRYQDFYG